MRDTAATSDGPEPDVREVLDRELAALPEAYRAAVVVCDLEGLGRREAAARLGWTEGTLSGRLARDRALLARRPPRYGLAVPAGVLGAAVPAGLAESTTRLGVLVAAGGAEDPADSYRGDRSDQTGGRLELGPDDRPTRGAGPGHALLTCQGMTGQLDPRLWNP